MAHESFEDPETAALMNALFVNIKVDREERPDIDALYMNALQLLGEQGGWPLTMFLTPKAEPFWGGTYFPPEPRYGRPSFRQVLQGIAEAYRGEGAKIGQNVAALKDALGRMAGGDAGAGPGRGGADPDRPRPGAAPRTRRKAGSAARRNSPTRRSSASSGRCGRRGQPGCAEAVDLLLRRMSQGGIYDHLGGGYARYSTDAIWLVPHFEKMLYDNAQILELLALAHAGAARPAVRRSAPRRPSAGCCAR